MMALVDRSVLRLACGKQERYQLLRSIRALQAFLFFYHGDCAIVFVCWKFIQFEV
jgi:hypothetical protein